jgi:hypothetical protein
MVLATVTLSTKRLRVLVATMAAAVLVASVVVPCTVGLWLSNRREATSVRRRDGRPGCGPPVLAPQGPCAAA